MAVAYASIANTAYGSKVNTTITKPTGVESGDLLLLWHVIAGSTVPVPTPPSGFELVPGPTWPVEDTLGGFTVKDRLYYKVAGASEPTSYTVTHTTASTAGIMVRVTGAGASPKFVAAVNHGGTPTGTTAVFPSITTAAANALVATFMQDFGDTSNTLTGPSGTTPTFTTRLTTVLGYCSTGTAASSGATGEKTMTTNSSAGDPWATAIVAIEPPGEEAKTSQGKAAGAAAGSGTAAGTALPSPTKQGKATGTATGSGAAKGQVVHEGKAAGSASISGTAKGAAIAAGVSQGKAAGTATGSGTAKGTAIAPAVAQGKAAGTAAGSGTAKGVVVHEGKAAGLAAVSGTAAGKAISSSTAQGRAAGTAAVSGTGAARVIHRGVAAGTAHVSGTARAVGPEHVAVLRVSYPAYFPTGTTVELYVDPHIGDLFDLGYESVPVTRFLGDVVATQVMPSSEEIEFSGTGVEEEEDYLAYANVGGDQRLVRLRLSSQR